MRLIFTFVLNVIGNILFVNANQPNKKPNGMKKIYKKQKRTKTISEK